MLATDTSNTSIVDTLQSIVGPAHVLTSAEDREFYGMDVYRSLALPMAVVQPGSVEELSQIVKAATDAGISVVPRGGGASYTDGYLPMLESSISVDTSRLNRIVEVNATDMYAVVECGVTWAELDAELKKHGLRAPFWGPFSGLKATIGGSTSQGSLSMGSGAYGTSSESVLSMEVVLANGEIIQTGALAAHNGKPFFRSYGPDLTGLFTCDAGALGVKARISLRLIKRPAFKATCSFGFEDYDAMTQCLAAVARENLADINWGLDPALQSGQLARTSAADARRAAFAVFKNSRNVFEGAWRLLKLAVAGKRFFDRYPYSAHFVVDGPAKAVPAAKANLVRKIAGQYGAEIANTAPTVIAAMPFIPLYPILGPQGERWVPQHGIMPFSKMKEIGEKLKAFYAKHQERMDALTVYPGTMFMTVSTHAFLIEPVFYWQDERSAYHKRYLPQDYLDTLPEYPANPKARELVAELREGIIELFREVGAIHMQAGKTYPYLRGRQPTAKQALEDIKRSLDPNTLMNPGALDGLNVDNKG